MLVRKLQIGASACGGVFTRCSAPRRWHPCIWLMLVWHGACKVSRSVEIFVLRTQPVNREFGSKCIFGLARVFFGIFM